MTIRQSSYQVPQAANQDKPRGAQVITLQRTDYSHTPDRRFFLATAVGLTLAAIAFGAALVGTGPTDGTRAHQSFNWADPER
jgi:hypothetical protein